MLFSPTPVTSSSKCLLCLQVLLTPSCTPFVSLAVMLSCSEWSRTHDVLGFLHSGGWLLWYDLSQCKLNARLHALLLLKFNIGQRITSKFQRIKVDIVMIVFSQMLLHLLILLFFLWTWRLDSQLGNCTCSGCRISIIVVVVVYCPKL